jgi:chloramphenicol 3-O phosphotransferase
VTAHGRALDTVGVTGTSIVLNGASSSGKSSIALALQHRWPGPLQVSGLDTFLSCQSAAFFGVGDDIAPGFSWRPATIGGRPGYRIALGPAGRAVTRAAAAFWRSCAEHGLDQVIDDVWVTREQADELHRALAGLRVLWVGVHCPLDVLEARERDRGDRRPGTARGQFDVIHGWRPYDIEVDTSALSPQECAERITAALD